MVENQMVFQRIGSEKFLILAEATCLEICMAMKVKVFMTFKDFVIT